LQVLVCLLRVFDAMWVGMEAGYMDFPHVLAELKTRIAGTLARKPLDSGLLYVLPLTMPSQLSESLVL
jgi:hypothetical protein